MRPKPGVIGVTVTVEEEGDLGHDILEVGHGKGSGVAELCVCVYVYVCIYVHACMYIHE
jgi:hypothetical protein